MQLFSRGIVFLHFPLSLPESLYFSAVHNRQTVWADQWPFTFFSVTLRWPWPPVPLLLTYVTTGPLYWSALSSVQCQASLLPGQHLLPFICFFFCSKNGSILTMTYPIDATPFDRALHSVLVPSLSIHMTRIFVLYFDHFSFSFCQQWHNDYRDLSYCPGSSFQPVWLLTWDGDLCCLSVSDILDLHHFPSGRRSQWHRSETWPNICYSVDKWFKLWGLG